MTLEVPATRVLLIAGIKPITPAVTDLHAAAGCSSHTPRGRERAADAADLISACIGITHALKCRNSRFSIAGKGIAAA